MYPEPFRPDIGRVGVEGLKYRAVMPWRGIMRIFAVVQEDPRPVFVAHAHMDVGRFEFQLPGADDELVLTNYGDSRQIHTQGG